MKKKFYCVIFITFCLLNLSCDKNFQPLLIGYWNVENLFDLIDDPDKNDDEFSIGGRKNVTDEIYQLKLSHIAETLTDLNADVVGLSEVENKLVLEDLLKVWQQHFPGCQPFADRSKSTPDRLCSVRKRDSVQSSWYAVSRSSKKHS